MAELQPPIRFQAGPAWIEPSANKVQLVNYWHASEEMHLLSCTIWIGASGGGVCDATAWMLINSDPVDRRDITIATFFWDHYRDPTAPHQVYQKFGGCDDHYIVRPGERITFLTETQAWGKPSGIHYTARVEWKKP